MDIEDDTQAQSLSLLFQGCLDRYSKLCWILRGDSCQAVRLGNVDLDRARCEYGRLRLWGSQSKATLPPQAQGSLDDMLRHDQSLKDRVADMFQLLTRQLQMGTDIVLLARRHTMRS